MVGLADPNVLTERQIIKAGSRVDSQMVMAEDIGSIYGGTLIKHAVDVETALVEAGLDWEVKVTPKLYAADKRTVIPGERGTIRVNKDGTKVGLGAVRGRYTVMQNWDAFKWLQKFLGNGRCITSAGSLHGGRLTWICVDLGEFDVVPGDSINRHLLIMNSHDGSSNIIAMLLPNRIACQNVLNFHLSGGGGSEPFKIRHTGSAMIRLDEAKRVFEVAEQNFGEVKDAFKLMARTKVNEEMENEIIYSALGVTEQDRIDFAEGKCDYQPQWVNKFRNIKEYHADHEGMKIKGVRGTVWGTYNLITGWYDWGTQTRNADKRPDNVIESKIMKHGANKKIEAFKACIDFCRS